MKRALAFLGLAWLGACSFDYRVVDNTLTGGASGDTSAAGAGADMPAPNCHDGERNGDETGIDCGMAACSKQCPPGQGCSGDADCDGGKCSSGICMAASCSDGLQNGEETDIDCGGQQGCKRCSAGLRCGATTDCDGGLCTNGQCQKPTCKDGLQNQDETDIDCGGATCGPCEAGQACSQITDCDNAQCTKDKCQAPSCSDKLQNQDETDVDCGGGCDPCADTLKCKVARDCTSSVCKSLTCATPTCTDKVKNGDEPAVDCGGSCPKKCAELSACGVDADCTTGSCVNMRCVPKTATGQVISPLGWAATPSPVSDPSANKQSVDQAPNAIDGVAGSYWTSHSTQAVGMWFDLDMLQDQAFFSIEMDCFQQANDFPAALSLYVSEDGTFSDPPVRTQIQGLGHTVVTFTQAQVARYIRLQITQTNAYWWSIDEIRVKQ